MPGHNDDKIHHSGCPIDIQHVTGQAFSQCHKGCPFRLSYGCQIPYGEWSRNGSRRPGVARECFLVSMKQKAVDSIHMDELEMKDELNTRPMPSNQYNLTTNQNTSPISDANRPRTSKTYSTASSSKMWRYSLGSKRTWEN